MRRCLSKASLEGGFDRLVNLIFDDDMCHGMGVWIGRLIPLPLMIGEDEIQRKRLLSTALFSFLFVVKVRP